MDYSSKELWLCFPTEEQPQHAVDTFYLYPTSVSPTCQTDVSDIDDHMKRHALLNFLRTGDALSPVTNMYAPFHRQISGQGILKAGTAEELQDAVYNSVVREDVRDALDYYFENCNNGRPFIFAGHSQGTCNLKIVLSEYMTEHPEYMERMVACYAIGYYFPDSWFAENPQVKKAQGEDDYGVLISWNAEGPDCKGFNLPIGNNDSFNINPLNWKTDETPAGIELNKGSLDVNEETLERTIVEGRADATIDLERGVVIASTCQERAIPANPIFGEKSYHLEDWALYFQNIRENAQKRIDAYLADRK